MDVPANQLQWNEWEKQPMGQFFVLDAKFPLVGTILWLAEVKSQIHDSSTIVLIKALKQENSKCS